MILGIKEKTWAFVGILILVANSVFGIVPLLNMAYYTITSWHSLDLGLWVFGLGIFAFVALVWMVVIVFLIVKILRIYKNEAAFDKYLVLGTLILIVNLPLIFLLGIMKDTSNNIIFQLTTSLSTIILDGRFLLFNGIVLGSLVSRAVLNKQ